MLKSDAIKQEITAKVAETEKYRNEGKIAEAKVAAQEILKLKDKLDVQLTLEKTEDDEFFASAKPLNKPTGADNATLRNRAFNKLLFNKFGRLTDEERQAYYNVSNEEGQPGSPGLIESTATKGGYLVPEEQMTQIREFRKAYASLKSYCHVVHANSTSGKWPTLGEENGLLTAFDELTAINESDFNFGQATYEIADYGDIIPISNQLIADVNVNIMSIIGQRLARKAVNTENSLILTKLNALTATAISDFKGLNKALVKDLDPVYLANAKIITNQDGFLWLSNLVDGQQRPLLQPDVTAPDIYRYKGKPVVVIPNGILPNTTASGTTTAPFFVGNLADYLIFFERQGIELSVSTEYLWGKNGTAIRAICRFGTALDDTAAMKAYKVTVS